MTGKAYVLGGSGESSLAEIRQEMSEMLDKQVIIQNEKNFRVHASSHNPRMKCATKMIQRN